MRRFIPFSIAFLLAFSARAQTLRLHIAPDEALKAREALSDFKPKAVFPAADTVLLRGLPDTLASSLLQHLQGKAYLSASIDAIVQSDSSHWLGQLSLGPPLYWIRLQPDSSTAAWMPAGFEPPKALYYTELRQLQEILLRRAENRGYPFASVQLDSLRILEDGGVSALLHLEPRQFVHFGALQYSGDVRLPPAYLPAYLGIRSGAPYNAAQVLAARARLRELPFLESTANPVVRFGGDEAVVQLFIKPQKASRFDFILGLLPQPDGTDSRLLITGSLDAAFQNALSLGEHFQIKLQRLKPETQELQTNAGIPYLFGTPLSIEGSLNVFKRDSSWVDANSRLGLGYLLGNQFLLKLLWDQRNSSLQNIDTNAVIATRRLPSNPDLRQNGYGLEASGSKLDYRFNPRKGYTLALRGIAGFSSIKRNGRIESLRDPAYPDFNFGSLYDSLDQRQTRWRMEMESALYLPLWERSTLKMSLEGGSIFSEKPVFINEQYRLGGNKRLRGFNEQAFFATRFALLSLEYRLLIGENSYLSAFTDYAYLENFTESIHVYLRPWGFGTGLNFETPAGIFGISVAIGRADNRQAFDFRAAKFHIGYVSLF